MTRALPLLAAALALGAGCAKAVQGTDAVPGTDADTGTPATDAGPDLCGNGQIDGTEPCDDGNDGDQTNDCLDGCIAPSCGDGFLHAGVEACDDGNALDADGCSATCVPDCGVFGFDAFGYLGCAELPAASPCDDITATGTDTGLTDDDWTWIPIGFDFDFYGTARSMVAIGANGALQFEDVGVPPASACLTGLGTGGSGPFVAAFWDDLRAAPVGNVLYELLGTAPARRLVVQWAVPHFPDTPSAILVRAVLDESGDVTLCYPDVTFDEPAYDYGANAAVGIQASPSLGLGFSCGSAALADGMVVRFAHP